MGFDEGHIEQQSVVSKTNAVAEKPLKITIILPTNGYFLSGIRNLTMDIIKNVTGFSEKWAFRFQSIVDELCNNAIEFGSAPGQDIKVTFVSMKDKFIEVFVQDTGTGTIKKTAKEMTQFIADRRRMDPTQFTGLRGRGLAQIVSNWTDVLEYSDNKDGGLTVHVVKNIEGGENL